MNELKIAIVGAGGVGGYIAAKLVKNMYDVTLFARGEHYKAIKQNGLKVLEYKEEDFTVYPNVVEDAGDVIYDIVLIAVKSYDFKSACKKIEKNVDENTLVIPLANGVEHKRVLEKYLPLCRICEGAIYIISNIEKPGVINRKSFTFYLLFGGEKEYPNLKVLESILNESSLRSKYTPNIKYECWKKYLFISSMAALSTYFKEPMGYVVKEQLELFIDILLEIQKLANKKGIDISNNDIQKAVKQATHVPYESKTSMQLDFEKGNQSEIESLCGYIVNQAEELDVDTPNMKKIYYKLKESL